MRSRPPCGAGVPLPAVAGVDGRCASRVPRLHRTAYLARRGPKGEQDDRRSTAGVSTAGRRGGGRAFAPRRRAARRGTAAPRAAVGRSPRKTRDHAPGRRTRRAATGQRGANRPNSEVSKEYVDKGVRTGRMVGFFKDFTRSDHPAEGRHPLSLSLPSTLLCAAWRSSVVEPEARHLAKGDPLVRRLRAPPHEGGTAMSIVVCIGCSFAC